MELQHLDETKKIDFWKDLKEVLARLEIVNSM